MIDDAVGVLTAVVVFSSQNETRNDCFCLSCCYCSKVVVVTAVVVNADLIFRKFPPYRRTCALLLFPNVNFSEVAA
jgi:hypothetical protein